MRGQTNPGKLNSYEAADGHDDYAMAAVWGLFVLSPELIERYYNVEKFEKNILGESQARIVLPYENLNESERNDLLEKLNVESENNSILEADSSSSSITDLDEEPFNFSTF